MRPAGYWQRLVGFALFNGISAYLVIQGSLAWLFTRALTHPSCPVVSQDGAEAVWLKLADGGQLRAWYTPPTNGAVIITLGGLGGAGGEDLPPIGFLQQAGYGTLELESRACMQPPRPVTLGALEIQEASAAVDFLLNQPNVTAIGMYGFSMGGAAAIRTAALRPEIAAVVAEGSYHNLGAHLSGIGQPMSVFQHSFMKTIAASYRLQTGQNPDQIAPFANLPSINPRPVLLVYGENETAGRHAYEQYNTAHEQIELWVVPGGSHGRNHLAAPEDYQVQVSTFFDRNLIAHSK